MNATMGRPSVVRPAGAGELPSGWIPPAALGYGHPSRLEAPKPVRMNVLVRSCGPWTTRFAVFHASDGHPHLTGVFRHLGTPDAALDFAHEGQLTTRRLPGGDGLAGLRAIFGLLRERQLLDRLVAVGHRVVHGGSRFTESTAITPEVVEKIEACVPLSPLHNPANLLGIEVAKLTLPRLPHVAVFDTAFHQTMPPPAYLYAVPYAWFEKHEVRRYGFHGTSHRGAAERAVRQLGLDPADHALVTAHLGNGCSLAAVRDGRSVDTTMGLTPLEGVVMDTRCGTIDPSIISHMERELGCTAEEVMDQLHRGSGLLGLSGVSSDLLTIEAAAASGHVRAGLALDKFCHSVAKAAAAMIVSLGRIDALVFTGGIGENATLVRARIVRLLGFAGLELDEAANALHGAGRNGRITRSTRPVAAVLPTDEERLIARDALEVVQGRRAVARW
jgi:acetate kinase